MITAGGVEKDSEEERRLVEAARTDPEAFAALYRMYLPKIHAFAYRRARSRDVAEDVTAATFERAYRQLDTFEWRSGGFGSWLFRIASNEITDHYRKQNRSVSERGQVAMGALFTHSTSDDVERIDQGDGSTQTLLHALGTLNPRYQQAVQLRYLSGLSHEDAAEAMGLSKPVMAVTLSRAMKALRKAMDRLDPQAGEEVS